MDWDPLLRIWRTGWDLHPSLVLALGGLVVAYAGGTTYLARRDHHRLSRRHSIWFGAGVLTLFLVLQSPLHHLSDTYLFSAHMAQHKLIILGVAPMLLLGTPGWLVHGLLDRRSIRWFAHTRAYAIVAFGVFNLLFAFVHFPAIYDGLFGSELTHRAVHIAILVGAMFTWLPLLSPVPDLIPRLSQPAQMLYCFVQSVPGALVGSLLTLTDYILYRHYGPRPLELGVAPLIDQQLGGLLMWVVGGTFWLGALTVIFYVWANRQTSRDYLT